MIIIDISETVDPNLIGPFKFYFSKISIGRGRKNNIIIEDSKIDKYSILLEQMEKGIAISGIDCDFFFVNDKKYSGKKVITINDTFSIGSNIFILKEFEFDSELKTNLSLNKVNPEVLKDKNIKKVLKSIEQEINYLETNTK